MRRLRETAFAVLAAVAALMIGFGTATFHPGAGWIVGGFLLLGWAWLVLSEGK